MKTVDERESVRQRAALPPSGNRWNRRQRRLAIAAAGLVIGVGLVAVIIVPGATVTVLVAGTRLETDTQFQGSTVGGTDFVTHAFQASDSVSQSVTATGQRLVPAAPATGQVVFRCISPCGGGVIPVPLNTIVLTGDQRQYTTQIKATVTLDPVPVAVTAVVPGARGNADQGSIQTILDPGLSPLLTVTNPSPISGGAEPRTDTVVQQSDIDGARVSLAAQLSGRLHDMLKAQASGLHLISGPQPQYQSQSDASVGDAVANFNLTLSGNLKAVGWTDQTIHAMLRDRLRARLPSGMQLTADPIKTSYQVTVANEDGSVSLQGHAIGYMMPSFSVASLRNQIKGRLVGSAKSTLARLAQVVSVSVSEQPVPLPWLPFLASHITIEVKEAPAGQGAA